jgi:hypothetical protein
MREALRQFGLGVIVLMLSGSAAWAQVCSGAVPISNTSRYNAGGALLFAEDTMGFSGIVQGGNSNFFGGFQIGRVTVDAPGDDVSSTVIGGRVGAQFTYEMERPLHVCPVFTLSRQSASDVGDVDDLDLSSTSIAFGADVGLLVHEVGTTQIVPTAGLYFARISARSEFEGEELFDDSESGGLFNVGAGIIFNQRFSVTPLVSFPFGFGEGTDPSFSITALYAFGAR